MTNVRITLSHAEASALSCAAVWADGEHRHPALQSARIKLREALDKPDEHKDQGEQYIRLEC